LQSEACQCETADLNCFQAQQFVFLASENSAAILREAEIITAGKQ
jgi:hypothetical protein